LAEEEGQLERHANGAIYPRYANAAPDDDNAGTV